MLRFWFLAAGLTLGCPCYGLMDIRHYALDPPPPTVGFADPGTAPPSFIYGLGQNAPPYNLSVDTLEPFPGCDAYHSSVCAVQHAIRLVTKVREGACPSIEAGGAARDAALSNISSGMYFEEGTRGFGAYVIAEDGTILADQLDSSLIGQRINGYRVSGFIAQPALLGYIDYVTRWGGGFVPHFSTRVSEDGASDPLPTSTYFESCATGERVGVALGREPLAESLPCDSSYNSFCSMQNTRRVVGLMAVDALNSVSGDRISSRWYDITYSDVYTAGGSYTGTESQINAAGYPGSLSPFPDNYGTVMAVGGLSGYALNGHNLSSAYKDMSAAGMVIGANTMVSINGAAYRGGAWQDHYLVHPAIGYVHRVTFTIGFVVNGTPYCANTGFVHVPQDAISGPSCQACSPNVSWPCAISNAWRLAGHAASEFLTPDGTWDRISSDLWFGSSWDTALAQLAAGETQTWPTGFYVMAFNYNSSCVGHGGSPDYIGKDAAEVFGDNTTHSLCIAAADSGGAWVARTTPSGSQELLLVKKAAKSGEFFYLAVAFQKAWAPWEDDCSAEYSEPCSERNVQALVGMAAAELLGSTDQTDLQAKMMEVANRTGSFSSELRGDFSVHVLSSSFECIDGLPCEPEDWPSYWFTLLETASTVEEGTWATLPASGSFKDSTAFVFGATWQELSGLDTFDFVLVARVIDEDAPPRCSSESDCPANSVCTSTGCQCEGGFLSNVTEVQDSCNVLSSSTLECLDVAGLLCEGTTCMPCPEGYYCFSGTAYPCRKGLVCPEGTATPEACPAGTMGVDSMATTFSSCVACQPGNFSSEEGSTSCEMCDVGTASSAEGSVSCGRCDIGTYQESLGMSACSACPSGFSTTYRAATSLSDCVCPSGTYLPLSGLSCRSCPEGTTCPEANSTEAAMIPVTSPLYSTTSSWASPTALDGYMMLPSQGLGAYRCKENAWCPGGAPGACARNRDPDSVGCSRCITDHYSDSDGSCRKCEDGVATALMVGAAIIGLVGLAVMARMVNRNQLNQPNTLTTAVITLGLTVSAIQTLGIFSTIAVRWVEPMRTMVSALLLFSFDFQVLRVECMVGSHSVLNAALRQSIAPFAAVYITFVVAVKKALLDPNIDINVQVTNAVGAVYQLFFVSIFVSVLTPFVCYKHPGNLGYSMVGDPAVLCTHTGEHWELVLVSCAAVVLVILPYLSLITFATVRYRVAMSSSHVSYRHLSHGHTNGRFRFLFFRYTPDCYWYGAVTLFRGAAVCLIPVVFRDVPSMQILGLCIILLSVCALQLQTRPWRSLAANLLDAGINILLVLLLVCVAMSTDFSNSDTVLGILAATLFVLVFIGVTVVAIMLFYRHLIPTPYFARFICHHKADAAAQARYLQILFQQRTKQLCFIDSDHLTNLEELFDIVRCRCGDLTVYLTADTLKRPWCAGEITIAWQVHRRATAIHHPSFVRPTEENLQFIDYYLASSDFKLVEYGITNEFVSQAFRWLLDDLPTVFRVNTDLDGRRRFENVVDQILWNGNSRSQSLTLASPATSASFASPSPSTVAVPDATHRATGSVVISSAPNDDEAIAAVGILVGRIQAGILEVVSNGLLVLSDYHPSVHDEVVQNIFDAHCVIVVLSARSLASKHQLEMICNSIAEDVPCIPVSLPTFRFPSPQFFMDLQVRMGEKAAEVEPRLVTFFKVISVAFTTYASQQVLDVQAGSLVGRIPKTRTVSSKRNSDYTAPQVWISKDFSASINFGSQAHVSGFGDMQNDVSVMYGLEAQDACESESQRAAI